MCHGRIRLNHFGREFHEEHQRHSGAEPNRDPGGFDSQTFGVFDAFETREGREAHLKGSIDTALMQPGTELLARAPEIRRAAVLADKLVAGK